MKTIGEILKEARESRGLSQKDVASAVIKITGETFSRAALAQIESGSTKNPKPQNLLAACDVLSIDFRSAIKGEIKKRDNVRVREITTMPETLIINGVLYARVGEQS